jgi:hypothetical protein
MRGSLSLAERLSPRGWRLPHLANARSKVGAETTAQLVRILGPRLPEPDGIQADESIEPLGGPGVAGQKVAAG